VRGTRTGATDMNDKPRGITPETKEDNVKRPPRERIEKPKPAPEPVKSTVDVDILFGAGDDN